MDEAHSKLTQSIIQIKININLFTLTYMIVK